MRRKSVISHVRDDPSLQGRYMSTMNKRTAEKCSDLIYDVGMHRGEDTELYLAKGFRVVAFEANPDLINACKTRFADKLADGRLTIVEGAIMGETAQKTVTFYQNPVATIWGTTDPQWAERNARMGWASEEVTVNVVNFADCIEEYGMPYFLKIDIVFNDKWTRRNLLGI